MISEPKTRAPPASRGEERADAEPVARQKEAAVPHVPDGDRELAVEAGQAVGSVLLVRVQDDLGVGGGAEPVPSGLQVQSQLRVVEHLTVEDDPQGLVFVRDGLLAGAQVDDAQAGIAEPDVVVEVDAELVGSAMADRPEHRAEGRFVRGRSPSEIADSDDAAHQRGYPRRRGVGQSASPVNGVESPFASMTSTIRRPSRGATICPNSAVGCELSGAVAYSGFRYGPPPVWSS